jgi:hypothetical protein
MKVEMTKDEERNNTLISRILLPLISVIILNIGLLVLINNPEELWETTPEGGLWGILFANIVFIVLVYLIALRTVIVIVSWILLNYIALSVKILEFFNINPFKTSSTRLRDFQLLFLYWFFCELALFVGLIYHWISYTY